MVLPAEVVDVSGFDSSDEEFNDDVEPILINWLELTGDLSQVLGISGLPGCRFKDVRRNLEKDIKQIIEEGVKDVYVLCTPGELKKYRVPRLIPHLTESGLLVHHTPFPDGEVLQMGSLVKLLEGMKSEVFKGSKSLIHCYGGLGRSCFVACCLLMMLDPDLDADTAIQQVRVARGPGAVQSVKQYNFIHDFREKLAEYEKSKTDEARSISR